MSGKIKKEKRRRAGALTSARVGTLVFFAVLFILIIMFAQIYNTSLKPVIRQVAQYKAEQLSAEAVSDGVIKVLKGTEIKYEDIVDIARAPDGRLTSLSVNLYKVNELKSQIILCINEIINNENKVKIYIPLGNITGIELFSGMGPMLPVELVPEGNTLADFDNQFTSAGINQTRHTVALKIVSKVSMIMPGNLSVSAETVSYVPIAESIIAGDIPESNTILETSPYTIRDDILNLQ